MRLREKGLPPADNAPAENTRGATRCQLARVLRSYGSVPGPYDYGGNIDALLNACPAQQRAFANSESLTTDPDWCIVS